MQAMGTKRRFLSNQDIDSQCPWALPARTRKCDFLLQELEDEVDYEQRQRSKFYEPCAANMNLAIPVSETERLFDQYKSIPYPDTPSSSHAIVFSIGRSGGYPATAFATSPAENCAVGNTPSSPPCSHLHSLFHHLKASRSQR